MPRNVPFRARDIRDCHDDLEDTYLVRVFALFETALRRYWRQGLGRNSRPSAKDLLNSIASNCSMTSTVLERTQSVREYRNKLVHEGDAPPVTLAEARGHLCTYLSNLPRYW